MSTKLKIVLGLLLLVAGFLIVRVGSSFYNSAKTAALISQTLTTPAPEENFLTKDSDGDGLSDRDEIIYATDMFNKDTDGDGYWDGEEITTGYDPIDADSNPKTDKKSMLPISQSANLTDRLLNLSVAYTINDSGNFDPAQVTDEQYADILQSISDEAALSLFVPPLADSDIKITEDNSPETIKKYLNSITVIIEEGFFSSVGIITADISNATNPSSEYPNHYQKTYESLKIIEVPSSWKEIHKATLLDFLQLATYFRAMQNLEKDPVKASFALSQIQESFMQLPNLLNQATRLAKSQNIPTEDSILEMIRSANNLLPQSK